MAKGKKDGNKGSGPKSGSKSTTKTSGKTGSKTASKGSKGAKKPVKEKKEVEKTKSWKDLHSHLFPSKPKNFQIGCDIQPERDLSRFVKWPRYIRIQRQRAILKKRLKVPPAINQFTHTLDKNHADTLFKLLIHYKPETQKEKKERLLEVAKKEAAEEKKIKAEKKDKNPKSDKSKDDKMKDDKPKDDKMKDDKPKDEVKDEKKKEKKEKKVKKSGDKKEVVKPAFSTPKPVFMKHGINHITKLVETRRAKLVVIAHDVDPIELVIFLPALCKKMEVPYCVVKSKARLGQLVYKKTASCVALSDIRKEDIGKFDQLLSVIKQSFNENISILRKWGGSTLSNRSQAAIRKKQKTLNREQKPVKI